MSGTRILSVGVAIGLVLGAYGALPPSTAQAAWVNSTGSQFQVGGQLTAITPTNAGTSFASPACGSLGGTSLAAVQGLKLQGVDPLLHPVALVVSCLDNSPAQLNFIDPGDGKVIRQFSTTAAPTNGWAHLVHRQDKGDLLGCGNGVLYSIDFSQTTTTVDGTATSISIPPLPAGAVSCNALTWDAEADLIYMGISIPPVIEGPTTYSIVRFQEGAALPPTTIASPCATNAPNGLAISGGVLLVSCQGQLTIHRLDKNTGASLGVFPTLTATGLESVGEFGEPGLGDFACDPVTYHKDATGRDLFTDALWSRRGINGNRVVALEFPAYTCGMPSSSVVLLNSPLAAGLGAPSAGGPASIPRAGCFDANGQVIDADGDGLPDCWETSGVDFDGDGTIDLQLCVQVNINGDGVTLTQECASATQKDLFVEIDYMQDHKPDPQALSQAQSFTTVGVKSVREAFAAAPVSNPSPSPNGIRIHFQVDEQVVFNPLSGGPTSHVNQVAFTPCTGPASGGLDPTQTVDFDTIKAGNFGTLTERTGTTAVNTLNAKRLAFRYAVFAHNLVGNPSGGSNGSGCAEIGGDDAVVTLGSFALTTVNNVSHRRGSTDQQAGTFMHEFGHLLGFGHGGSDNINCKPNYRSVMNYTRQFAGSPIANRRLDYSRSADPVIPNSPLLTGLLNEGSLNEGSNPLGTDSSLGPIPPAFPTADTIVYGPNAWSIVAANAASINWNRSKSTTPQSGITADINAGATSGCDGAGTLLEGQDDWDSVLYRASAAINFAGGRESPEEITSDQEQALYQGRDADGNGIGDGLDCGGSADLNNLFLCSHRIDIKPSFPVPKVITPAADANVKVAIFSEINGTRVWNAPVQVRTNSTLTLSVGSVTVPVKVNKDGSGTCSSQDVEDPNNGRKDGIKDLACQFPTATLPSGTHFGIVSGFFFDPLTGEERAFSARQEVTIVR